MQSSRAFTLVLPMLLASAASAQLTTTRVSVGSSGVQGNADSVGPALSADGRIVVFVSAADNFVAGDTNAVTDIFVRDLQTGVTTCVSLDPAGVPGNGPNLMPLACVSDDGRYVTFLSDATNLVASDTNGVRDAFVRDRQLALTTCINVSSTGVQGNGQARSTSISADGRYVSFTSDATNLVAGDTNASADTFVHDRQTGATTRVSIGLASTQGNGDSGSTVISGDGRYVMFGSSATNLVIGDTNSAIDVFVHDRQTAQTTRVSVDSAGLQANSFSFGVTLTSDGRYVGFQSAASNLVAGDTNGVYDAFVHDRLTSQTTRVSVDSAGVQGNGLSVPKRMTADGRYVVFGSLSTNLVAGDTNALGDVFVRDQLLGSTIRVSLDSAGAQASGDSGDGFISADARWVGFSSAAANLVAGDTNGKWDTFVRAFAPPCSTLSYCTSGTSTHGCNAAMFATGTPSASSSSGFTLTCGNVEGQRNGMIFYGVAGSVAFPWSTTSTSWMCVKSPIQRTITTSSGGTLNLCDGHISLDWNAFKTNFAGALGAPFDAGDIVYAQGWFRDPTASKTSNLSNAMSFVLCP